MVKPVRGQTSEGLEQHGILNPRTIYWNLSTPALYEEVSHRREGLLAHLGPVVVTTGHYTGRSPNDRFILRDPATEEKVAWGPVNRPYDEGRYARLRQRLMAHMRGQDVYVQDCFAGADRRYRLPVRVITETAWHSLFARNILIQATDEELSGFQPEMLVICAPKFCASPEADGTNSEAFVILNLQQKEVLIGGTSYAGEIKKSVFSVMNYLMPERDVLPMHCSANMGQSGDVAIFFGLSGTGKTTLSVTADRTLIGDDEHGWSNDGVFNFEGGLYAKVIRLSRQAEPQIYEATRRFGTVLENVAIDPVSRRLDLNDASLTENTRACFPITHLSHATRERRGGHPRTIVMLTADAFGVLPPVAKLTLPQAMYQFLLGYTAKVSGTERGIVEPVATFSTCFGAPFMVQHPSVYARLLGERIARHDSRVWLVNTGWSGGPYGVGRRVKIAYTRAMVRGILNRSLDQAPTRLDPVFGFQVPTQCEDVPPQVLDPRGTWNDGAGYDRQARRLAALFAQSFKQYEPQVAREVAAAGPTLAA